MFIKEYGSNRYVFLREDDYACKKNFYDELIRIQYNKVSTYPNTIDHLEQLLKKPTNKIDKQYNQRK
jgi:hypothetical protein